MTDTQAERERKIVTVDGLEMYGTQRGADYLAKFSWQKCGDGFEVVMHFRGERRFALCSHQNDAQVIAEAMNGRAARAELLTDMRRMAEALKWIRTECAPPVIGTMGDMPTINACWVVSDKELREYERKYGGKDE